MNETALIQENADYMLGMYDLYQKDEEIIQALKAKGLSDGVIERILNKIKAPSYLKRIRQAKRNIIVGFSIFIVFFLLPYFIIKWSGSTFSTFKNAVENEDNVPGFFKVILRFYFQFYIFFVLASLAQSLNGIINWMKYKKLLKEISA